MISTSISFECAQIFHKNKSIVRASCVQLVVNSPYFSMEMKPRVSVASKKNFHFKTFLPNLQSSIRISTFRDQEDGLRASDFKLPLSLSCGYIYSWYQSVSNAPKFCS